MWEHCPTFGSQKKKKNCNNAEVTFNFFLGKMLLKLSRLMKDINVFIWLLKTFSNLEYIFLMYMYRWFHYEVTEILGYLGYLGYMWDLLDFDITWLDFDINRAASAHFFTIPCDNSLIHPIYTIVVLANIGICCNKKVVVKSHSNTNRKNFGWMCLF